MKKVLYYLLILVMVLSLTFTLAACGGSGDSGDKTDDTTDNTTDDTGNNTDDNTGNTPDDKPGNDECTHSYVNGTCTKCGETDPNYTPVCDHNYADGVCTKCGEADPDYTPACDHKFNSVGRDPSCTQAGFAEYTCRLCGYSYTETFPILSHNYEEGRCTRCGAPDPNYVPCNHNYVDGICTECGKTKPTCNHNWVAPTCNDDGYCSLCGAKGEDATGHTPGEWITTTPPTCTEGGERVARCVNCDALAAHEQLPAIGHNYADGYCTNCKEPDPDYKPSDFSEGLLFEEWGSGYAVAGIGDCKDTDIYIPSTYNDLPVLAIKGSAFRYNANITSVVMPDSINYIGDFAFQSCMSLKTVVTSDNVTYMGRHAFSGCSLLESINIPRSLTTLETSVLEFNSSLLTLIIPTSITEVKQNAFCNYDYASYVVVYYEGSLYDWFNNVTVDANTANFFLNYTFCYYSESTPDEAGKYWRYVDGTPKIWTEDEIKKECNHNYVDGICTECGEADPDYVPECKHEFVDGYCIYCKEPDPDYKPECKHNYVDGVCTECGEADPDYVPECKHEFVDGYCIYCKEPDPDYKPECKHNYVDGICTECGEADPDYVPECKHEFVDGYCIYCKEPDPDYKPDCKHNWVETGRYDGSCYDEGYINYSCSECGETYTEIIPITESHSYQETVVPPTCVEQGYTTYTCIACSYTYTDNYVAPTGNHEFVDGYCIYCKEPDTGYIPGDCAHEWSDGICILCGVSCEHYFEGSTCIHCGYVSGGIDNPLIIWFEGMTYYVPYSATVYDVIVMYIGLSDNVLYTETWTFIPEGFDYELPLNEGTVLTDYIENGRNITFVRYQDTECSHNWISATCTEDGYCEWCGIPSGETALGHDFGNGQYCYRCDAENPDYYPEYVDFNLYFYLYYYNNDFGGYEEFIHYDKGFMETGGASEKRNTLGNFINEYANMGSAPYNFSELDLVWYANGVEIDESYLICQYDKIIAISAAHPTDFSTTLTVSFPAGNIEEVYRYPCPVDCYNILDEFVKKHDIDTNTYLLSFDYDGYTGDGLYYGTMTAYYNEGYQSAFVYLADNYTESFIYSSTYLISKYPTPRAFLEEAGLNPDDYVVFNQSYIIEDIDSPCGYMYLHIIEKSKVEKEITINVTYKLDRYSEEIFNGVITLNEAMPLSGLAGYEMMSDKGYVYLPHNEHEYVFIINGSVINSTYYTYLYEDCTLEIYPAYRVYLSFNNPLTNEYIEKNLTFTKYPTGAMILEGIDVDFALYTIHADNMEYSYDSFIGTQFAAEEFSVTLTPNRVNVTVWINDGSEYENMYEETISDIFAEVYLPSFEGEYVWTLYYPDGRTEIITNTDAPITLYFDPANYDASDYGAKTSHYKIVGVNQTFIFNVSTDTESYEMVWINKNEGLTVGEILDKYYGIEFDNYDWNYSCNDPIESFTKDFVPTCNIDLWGNDNRPRVTLYLSGANYKYYHTSSLTLSEIIAVFNEEHGLTLDFDSYIWSANGETINDPETVVATNEVWCEVTASVLSEVKVRFFSTHGVIGDYESFYTYTRDSEWITPNLESWHLESYYGIAIFNGEWEYCQYEGAVIPVNSIDELFDLKLTEVELYAKLDIDYERLCGLYYSDTGYIVEIKEDSLSYVSCNYGSVSEKYENLNYSVNLDGVMLNIYTDSMTFEGMMFQEDFKVTEEEIYVLVYDPFGGMTVFTGIEEYNDYVQDYNVDSAVDFYGNSCEKLTNGNVYFVHTSEKKEEEHFHEYALKSQIASTCTTQGYVTYCCFECGDEYREYLPTVDHNYAEGACTFCGVKCAHENLVTSTHAPTCNTQGYDSYECSCGYSYNEYLDVANGHTWLDGYCSVCGTEKQSEGFVFTLQTDSTIGNYYKITGCGSCLDTHVIIPDVYEGYPVRHIAKLAKSPMVSIVIPDSILLLDSSAFFNCASLTEVHIPKNVAYIDLGGFEGCSSLERITVDEENKNFKAIDGVLYSADGKTLMLYPAAKSDAEFIIPEGVTEISKNAFSQARYLKKVTFPEGFEKSVNGYQFYKCASLEEVVLSSTVKEISGSMFYDCANLSAITLPEGLIAIHTSAFEGCTSLTAILIPETVCGIGSRAFYGCTSLETVILSANIVELQHDAFSSCPIKSIIIPDSVKTISQAFRDCKSLEYVVIGNGVISISYTVFEYSSTVIYYHGTEEEWANVKVSYGNVPIENNGVIFFSESKPTTEGSFWHYVDGVPTVW